MYGGSVPNWLDEAAAVERGRELLAELDEHEAAAWGAWAWEARATAPAYVADGAREVAHDVERLRKSLRAFVAEHERAAAKKEAGRPPGSGSTPTE